MTSWVKLHYLDASAAIKLIVTDELGSRRLLDYEKFESPLWYMTSFCVAEALGVLKKKYQTEWRKNLAKAVAIEKYHSCCEDLVGKVRDKIIEIQDISIFDREKYDQAEKFSSVYGIDLLDAFQLVTVKEVFSEFKGTHSECGLITADAELADAARNEKLLVWDLLAEDRPPPSIIGNG